MIPRWQKWVIAGLFILVAVYLAWNVGVFGAELLSHNHDDRYYIDTQVEDRLRFLRNDIKFYIDHEHDAVRVAVDLIDRIESEEAAER